MRQVGGPGEVTLLTAEKLSRKASYILSRGAVESQKKERGRETHELEDLGSDSFFSEK